MFFSRCTLILNGAPISELLWTFPKVMWVMGFLTPWPETNWSCLLCSASRPATMCPSSNTDQAAKIGSSLTAWLTEKVSGLFFLCIFSFMHHLCMCSLAQLCVVFRRERRIQHPRGSSLPWGWQVPGNVSRRAGQSGASRDGRCGKTSLLWCLHVPVSEHQHVSVSLRGHLMALENLTALSLHKKSTFAFAVHVEWCPFSGLVCYSSWMCWSTHVINIYLGLINFFRANY